MYPVALTFSCCNSNVRVRHHVIMQALFGIYLFISRFQHADFKVHILYGSLHIRMPAGLLYKFILSGVRTA